MPNTDIPMRQLDWWETLQAGDRIVFTDDVDIGRSYAVDINAGKTVDEVFFQYKKYTGSPTALFYRPMEKTK